jgi:two-component system sensor histidine kinase/response regulator
VAGNIGAKPVQTAASQLEKLIREKSTAAAVETAKQQVASALESLIAGLKQVVDMPAPQAPSSTTTAPVNPARTRETAAQLTKLLAEFDPGAADFIETNRGALQPLFADGTWTTFQKLAQGYSFADAQVQLELALKNFSPT